MTTRPSKRKDEKLTSDDGWIVLTLSPTASLRGINNNNIESALIGMIYHYKLELNATARTEGDFFPGSLMTKCFNRK